VKRILEAFERSKRELYSGVSPELAQARACAVLAEARELWKMLSPEQRQLLGMPANEVVALLNQQRRQSSSEPTPEQLLARFGLQAFRPGQREAVQAALAGRDSLVVMPTGGGKSLCYQIPALTTKGLVVVVSPLIALMADQLRRLQAVGIESRMLASGMHEGHNAQALNDISSGTTRLVLAAPERFASYSFRQALAHRKVALFVVDEAHCVAEWGHDFRPDYLRLHEVIAALGRPPVMAATATATPRVAEEIAGRLGLRDWISIRSGFDRPNLTFEVLSVDNLSNKNRTRSVLLKILKDANSRPAIVYCGTRKDTERVAAMLTGRGISTVNYHAGMSPDARAAAQRAFMNGRAEVVVATNAFGMGIDKANVRTVVHWAVPKSLEAYYQEAGRAGRDGKSARAILLATRNDLGRLIRFNNERSMSFDDVKLYVGALGRLSRNGVLECGKQSQEERLLLSVAERSGALRLEPGRINALKVTLTGQLDVRAAHAAIQRTTDRGWESYRAIEQFISSTECRRRQILDFFGDSAPGAPMGRCCDVCDTRNGVSRGSTRSLISPDTGPPVDRAEFEQLKAWRTQRAAGKPVYVVATDATLKEILHRSPNSRESLLRISGIGPSFCERHGESLLQTLSLMRTGAQATTSYSAAEKTTY
jgi:RecQ family ATP-dependent DNA helicase